MDRSQWLRLIGLIGLFLAVYYLPIGSVQVEQAVGEGLRLTQWYAREHVILCLLPAFLIAGAISAYVDKAAILRYLGPKAPKPTAYGVGATSGCVLAVCSCTVLPLFSGIYRMGAGLGPAFAFLYAGPAINVLAVILTARVLGAEIGIARAIGAVLFSVIVGLTMARIFERPKPASASSLTTVIPDGPAARPLHQLGLLFGTLIAVLVFANWSGSPDQTGFWHVVHAQKWLLTAACAMGLLVVLWKWFGFRLPSLLGLAGAVAGFAWLLPDSPDVAFAAGVVGLCLLMPTAGEPGREWWLQTWENARLITPLLLGGVFAAGVLLGTPGHRGLIPPAWVEQLVGGNGLAANFGASLIGAFMYFATLTEIPIIEGLLDSGMGKGPALALLLAGPALSLPSMLVIRSVIGTRKTAVYVGIVVVGATMTGLLFGTFV